MGLTPTNSAAIWSWTDTLPKPSVLLVDRGYGSDNLRKTVAVWNAVPIAPMPDSRKLRSAVDRRRQALRNLGEQRSIKPKTARRPANRYAKTIVVFLGFIGIRSIRPWLHHLSP